MESHEDINSSVNFLFKTMLERDPKKRRVKPVQNDLVQVNFGGLEDSEEDSDFDINKHSQGSESPVEESDDRSIDGQEADGSNSSDDTESSQDSEERAKNGDYTGNVAEGDNEEELETEEEGSATESENDEDEDESDEESEREEEGDDNSEEEKDGGLQSPEIKDLGNILNAFDSDEDDEDYIPKKPKKKVKGSQQSPQSKLVKLSDSSKVVRKAPPTVQQSQQAHSDSAPQGRIKVVVCCVCLSDRSADDDEIVECDNCGISVHEGCYGISESHSTASTESSASTEPWFCDACKASAKPVCELCPNSGGIFKETDAGKWVHIVCALYTPGVAFGDVDKLSLVTLFEMPYSRWGLRECSLCDDSRFSHTGVCIKCDAGMCKVYFHVTCAQREGLLAEASPEEVMDIADPFFAYCKIHADKITSKIKRRNWLAIQSHVKSHTPSLLQEESEKSRFNRKLNRHREKYSIAKLKRPPSWVPTQKMVRHLHTSPSAVRGFLQKGELMGVITQAQSVPHEKHEARKKAQGAPAFTAEFINYFMGRNLKMDNLRQTLADLESQNNKLRGQERVVRRQYDQFQSEVSELKQTGNSIRREGESLCGMLADIYGKPVANIPEVFKNRKRTRSPSKKEVVTSSTVVINNCDSCQTTTDQHLMVKCDSCKKHYHLGCLIPPLTRMPKKTKLFGWQCSFCVKSSSDDSMKSAPDVDEPRKLRETIKEPDKFFHLSHIQDSLKSQQKKSLLSKKSKRRWKQRAAAANKAKLKASRAADKTLKSSEKQKTSPARSPKQPKLIPASSITSSLSPSVASSKMDIMCVVCNLDGVLTDTVRCDECMLHYHLQCLNPPMKKSPKVRGYAWHCEACDQLSAESDESDDYVHKKERKKKAEESVEEKKRPTGREASSSILFDIDVSSDDMD